MNPYQPPEVKTIIEDMKEQSGYTAPVVLGVRRTLDIVWMTIGLFTYIKTDNPVYLLICLISFANVFSDVIMSILVDSALPVEKKNEEHSI